MKKFSINSKAKSLHNVTRDALSGNKIEIKISHLHITLRTNNRCYSFRVEDGAFDGTSTYKTIKPFSYPLPTRGQHLQSSCGQPV